MPVDLTEDEVRVLRHGLGQWGGPAAATDELAILLGLKDKDDFDRDRRDLTHRIEAGTDLSGEEWRRALLATEVNFISDVVGAGHDWVHVTGFTDGETLEILRRLQRKLIGVP